jgi:predicted RNase H-like nuclease
MPAQAVVGIDVGAKRKGFHAVAMRDRGLVDCATHIDPAWIVRWCRRHYATIVAVDAPCKWSQSGSSRRAERDLRLPDGKIHCFSTPMRKQAINRGFYDWIFNAETLYRQLTADYPLFDGARGSGPACIETFPHAVVCFMAGRIVLARPKARVRREALENSGYDTRGLANIDFVDAALCALAAEAFRTDRYHSFGDRAEGFIVVPSSIDT